MTIKIGIASNHWIHPSTRFDTQFIDYIQIAYVDGIRQAGGMPVVFPLGKPEDAEEYMTTVDGLLLSGGQGVTPTLYGAEPIQEVAETDIYRDKFEIALIKAAVAAHKPVLGVCRGLQIINVALGGTLYQDIYKQMGATLKHNQHPTSWEIPTQHITTTSGSWINRTFGDRLLVNSFHHQGIHDLGKNLQTTATADDNVVEALESKDGSVYGVQFHPEMMFETHPEFGAVFSHLVNLASK